MIAWRLLIHLLIGTALLGAITHQVVAMWARGSVVGGSFLSEYAKVRDVRFTWPIIVLYVLVVLLGSTIYPLYRLDVRPAFEEMSMGWAIGLFEVKEHLAAIGLGCLPLYAHLWRCSEYAETHPRDRRAVTTLLALIVWFDFLAGHILNNIRGLS
jgi:hypothetical protein